MKKTILLAAMLATVASFADGNYVKFTTNVEKNFDTSYNRAKADSDSINKGQALTIKKEAKDADEKATYDLKKDAQTNDADKSVKFLDDAKLNFGPEFKMTFGDSGFSIGGKLMNVTTFDNFDLSRNTLADGNSEAWGMFVLPKELSNKLTSSVKFTLKTSKVEKEPELGLYNEDTKLDSSKPADQDTIMTDIDSDLRDNVKYMGSDNKLVQFNLKNNTQKQTAAAYDQYMDAKTTSIKTEGVLETKLDYALETKKLKSANIGLETSTDFEFKKDTGFATTYKLYSDIKGDTFSSRTELETLNNYQDSRFKGFKYAQVDAQISKGIFDLDSLAYVSLDKVDSLLGWYDFYKEMQNPTISYDVKSQDWKNKVVNKFEAAYLDAKKDEAKKAKESYEKSLNTIDENKDKDINQKVIDTKKDLVTESIKKDDSIAYGNIKLSLAGEPIKNLKLGLENGVYINAIADLGVKYVPATAAEANTEKPTAELPDPIVQLLQSIDKRLDYTNVALNAKVGNNLKLYADTTIYGINVRLSNDFGVLLEPNIDFKGMIKAAIEKKISDEVGVSSEDSKKKKENDMIKLNLKFQEKPALNLAYTYKYKDIFTLENKFGISGIINFHKQLLKEGSKVELGDSVLSLNPEINANIKVNDKLSFNAGTKVAVDFLFTKEEKPAEAKKETQTETSNDEGKNNENKETAKPAKPEMVNKTYYKTEVIPSIGVVYKATDKLTIDSTTSLDLNLINSRILKSAIKFGGSVKYEW